MAKYQFLYPGGTKSGVEASMTICTEPDDASVIERAKQMVGAIGNDVPQTIIVRLADDPYNHGKEVSRVVAVVKSGRLKTVYDTEVTVY